MMDPFDNHVFEFRNYYHRGDDDMMERYHNYVKFATPEQKRQMSKGGPGPSEIRRQQLRKKRRK